MSRARWVEWALVAAFVTAMAAANLAIAALGPWFLPVTAFVSVGLVLVSRDYLHDVWRDRRVGFWPRMISMIAAAGLLAFIVDSSAARIAIASTAALVSSALVETATFQLVFERVWMVRSNMSNVMGALTDSIVFPVVAFGWGMEGLALLVLTQMLTKAAGGFFWAALLRFTLNPDRRRALRRRRLAGKPEEAAA